MSLQPGDQLGPYRIQALLGIGGMGEVYRGRDTRLGRDVALKVIAPRFIGDASRRLRFEGEARAASALNHPSIVTVYDVGDTKDVAWIAMEWVEGRTLRQALSEGPLPIHDAVSIACQVADGLSAAHAKGVIHRDLKPENIMLAADGRAKILDFGLARQTLVDALEGSTSEVETVAAPAGPATFDGAILGTVGYMSPEQASGRAADFRSDQFAFGLIAYEMLAGRRAFERPTAVETLSAVIREDAVPVSAIRGGVPEPLQRVIARCLAKLPDERFSSTRQLAVALERIRSESSTDLASTAPLLDFDPLGAPRPARWPWPRSRTVAALGAALALALAAALWMSARAPTEAIRSLAVLPFENAGQDPDTEYLGDGLTESLIDQLSRIPSLTVMARATVFRFKGATDPRSAGQQLRVGAILTGTVARRDDRVLITAELVEISTGARLWGAAYNEPSADLGRVQDTIAAEIAEGLRLRLSGDEKRTLATHGTEDPEAYELLLKARHLLQRETEEDDLEARRLFLEAARKDPSFVEAHLGVATTYARSAGSGYAPPIEAWTKSGEEIAKALALDPDHVGARSSLAARRFLFEWEWAAAEREFLELSTDPRLFTGTHYHPVAMFYWATGRPLEAVSLVERALRVDPENLESRVMMADFLAQAGRLEEAIKHYHALADAAPDDPRPWFGLAEVLRRRGETAPAITALRQAYALTGEPEGTNALAGARTDEDLDRVEAVVARARLSHLQELAEERYVSPLDLARLYAQARERENALAHLELAVTERSTGLVFLKVDGAWDSVRHDPRFVAVVRKIGIP